MVRKTTSGPTVHELRQGSKTRFVASLLALVGGWAALGSPAQAQEIAFTEDGHPYVKGQMLVKVRSAPQLERFLDRTRSSLGTLAERKPLQKDQGGQWYLVQVNESIGASFAARDASAAGDVLYAEPNYIYTTMIGNRPQPGKDPEYDKAPRLPSPEVPDPQLGDLYGMRLINAETAWAITKGAANVVVGNIDTGIDYNHPDLINNLWTNQNEIPNNGKDDDKNGYVDDIVGYDFRDKDGKPFDDNGHGSHTAGTVGATGGNGIGITGVSQKVSIMSLRFLGGAQGSGTAADAISAIEYATANGAKLTSNSWGGGPYSQALFDVISDANDKGILFVAAAGNSKNDNDKSPSYPASYKLPNIIAVAASDANDELASFSNFGAKSVMLAAPGVNILSTIPNREYKRFSGTSMACPHVSGAAALLFAAYPSLSPTQVKDLLLSSVDTIAGLEGRVSTGGRMNLAKAFERARAQFGAPN